MSHSTFNEQDFEYLNGVKFSNSYVFKLKDINYPIETRINTLVDILKGKRVLHVGCCDHIGLIPEKVQRNIWLHGLFNKNCQECIGIDIDREALQYINENYCNNAHYFDIENDTIEGSVLDGTRWDYCVLGEILEHVDNPVKFLSDLKKKFSSICDNIIITVPSSFDYNLIKDFVNDKVEVINSDHRYAFSPFTLAKVFVRSGIKPDKLYFADFISPKGLFNKILVKTNINYKNKLKTSSATLIMTGKL
jgi:2-polyprenyl-3-methyl-5-hydroxy-6-metoxy-1,4-benzoquinol methylase